MASHIGNILQVQVFGQSHSEAIGCVIDGFPVGHPIDFDVFRAVMDRRAPGHTPWSTPRKEADEVEFLSGIKDGVTCGAPICAVIKNTNTKPQDYANIAQVARPGHADLIAQEKYAGHQDISGGGHFSGRLTAPLCVAGALASQYLETKGITIGAHLLHVHGIYDEHFDLKGIDAATLKEVRTHRFPTLSAEAGERMIEEILAARKNHDSVGGVVECAIVGMPKGVGEHMFGGIENKLAAALFGIPAVKGVEFGRGFEASELFGSENNDAYHASDAGVVFDSNNAGGILGGMSTGEPIIVRVAFKPTSSISREQHSVDLHTHEDATLKVHGRHDPCVAVRAVPVVEQVCAFVMLDALLEAKSR